MHAVFALPHTKLRNTHYLKSAFACKPYNRQIVSLESFHFNNQGTMCLKKRKRKKRRDNVHPPGLGLCLGLCQTCDLGWQLLIFIIQSSNVMPTCLTFFSRCSEIFRVLCHIFFILTSLSQQISMFASNCMPPRLLKWLTMTAHSLNCHIHTVHIRLLFHSTQEDM